MIGAIPDEDAIPRVASIYCGNGRAGQNCPGRYYREVEKSCKQHGRELPTKTATRGQTNTSGLLPDSRQHNGRDAFLVLDEARLLVMQGAFAVP